MEHIDKISEVVWHECGHLIISIISNKTILGFTIERNSEYNGSLHVSFGGNVCLNEIDDNIDIDVKSLFIVRSPHINITSTFKNGILKLLRGKRILVITKTCFLPEFRPFG